MRYGYMYNGTIILYEKLVKPFCVVCFHLHCSFNFVLETSFLFYFHFKGKAFSI